MAQGHYSKPTQDVVQRVRPLLERLATRTIDRARLLQYLSAMAGLDWGVFRLRDRFLEGGVETLVLEDRGAPPSTGYSTPSAYRATSTRWSVPSTAASPSRDRSRLWT